jgi:hypothetical protein
MTGVRTVLIDGSPSTAYQTWLRGDLYVLPPCSLELSLLNWEIIRKQSRDSRDLSTSAAELSSSLRCITIQSEDAGVI